MKNLSYPKTGMLAVLHCAFLAHVFVLNAGNSFCVPEAEKTYQQFKKSEAEERRIAEKKAANEEYLKETKELEQRLKALQKAKEVRKTSELKVSVDQS